MQGHACAVRSSSRGVAPLSVFMRHAAVGAWPSLALHRSVFMRHDIALSPSLPACPGARCVPEPTASPRAPLPIRALLAPLPLGAVRARLAAGSRRHPLSVLACRRHSSPPCVPGLSHGHACRHIHSPDLLRASARLVVRPGSARRPSRCAIARVEPSIRSLPAVVTECESLDSARHSRIVLGARKRCSQTLYQQVQITGHGPGKDRSSGTFFSVHMRSLRQPNCHWWHLQVTGGTFKLKGGAPGASRCEATVV